MTKPTSTDTELIHLREFRKRVDRALQGLDGMRAVVDRIIYAANALDEAIGEADSTDPDQTLEAVIQAAGRVVMEAALAAIENDPHQFSTRGCATCRIVSGIAGRPFGCVAKAGAR